MKNDIYEKEFNKIIEHQKKQMEREEENRFNKFLKLIFKNKIKVSFMFKVLEKIKKLSNDFKDLYKYYPEVMEQIQFNEDFILNLDSFKIDICNHIVAVHSLNTIFLDDNKRAEKQNNKEYILEVSECVIKQIKMREYGSLVFRKTMQLDEEDYLYFPPVYGIHVILTYLENNIYEYGKIAIYNSDGDKAYLLSILLTLVNKSKALIAIIDYKCFETGYSILRSVIELYIKYFILNYSKSDIGTFIDFTNYKMIYDEDNTYYEKFNELYAKVDKNVSKTEYLNYGWLDSIFEFNYLGEQKKYNFYSMLELANMLAEKNLNIKNYSTNIKKYYLKCHYYSHGNVQNTKYPIEYILEICNGFWSVLSGVIEEFNEMKQIKLINGVDIRKFINENINKLNKIKDRITSEKLDKFYRKIKNGF